MMKFNAWMRVLFCALGWLVLAANSAHANGVQCGLSTGKPAVGMPIDLGAIVGKTGPADFSSSARAADAYFKCVNVNGGIHGRPVRYTVTDDAWSPEQAAQMAAKLVRDQKVLALVGSSSFVDCSTNSKLYEKEGLVVIAGVGVPRDCFYSRNIVTTNQGPRLSNIGGAMYMQKAFGVKRIVCLAQNIPGIGDWGCGGMETWGNHNQVVVKAVLVDPGNLDATGLLLLAQSHKPDAIAVAFPKEQAVAIFAAAEQLGIGPKYKWFGPTSLYSADFPKAVGPYWDGRIFVQLELEPHDKGTRDTLNWLAVMNQYGNSSDPRDTFSQAGYLAARIATDALLKLSPEKIDRASVTKALLDVRGFRSDMMCGSWYFGANTRHNPNHAGSIVAVEKARFVPKEGCFEVFDPELKPIREMEAREKLNG